MRNRFELYIKNLCFSVVAHGHVADGENMFSVVAHGHVADGEIIPHDIYEKLLNWRWTSITHSLTPGETISITLKRATCVVDIFGRSENKDVCPVSVVLTRIFWDTRCHRFDHLHHILVGNILDNCTRTKDIMLALLALALLVVVSAVVWGMDKFLHSS